MGQLAQAPESGQNASFLDKNSTFKILKTGSLTITYNHAIDGNVHTEVVTHNLGFAPLAHVFYQTVNASYQFPFLATHGFTDATSTFLLALQECYTAFTDATNLYITITSTATGILNIPIRYYLLDVTTI